MIKIVSYGQSHLQSCECTNPKSVLKYTQVFNEVNFDGFVFSN